MLDVSIMLIVRWAISYPCCCRLKVSSFIYVCFLVHLELIDSLSAEAFIHCLRMFITRCSVPAKLYSDNGTSFVAANKFLKSLQECEEVQQMLRECTIQWQFNVPGAPWQGGNFERITNLCMGDGSRRRN